MKGDALLVAGDGAPVVDELERPAHLGRLDAPALVRVRVVEEDDYEQARGHEVVTKPIVTDWMTTPSRRSAWIHM